MRELVPAYPSAVVDEDNNGFIPFTETIIQWVDQRRAWRKNRTDCTPCQSPESCTMPIMVEWSLEILSQIVDNELDLSAGDDARSSVGSSRSMDTNFTDLNVTDQLGASIAMPQGARQTTRRQN
eukprot:2798773-Ditylum_brightwellii.AAC.1